MIEKHYIVKMYPVNSPQLVAEFRVKAHNALKKNDYTLSIDGVIIKVDEKFYLDLQVD